MTMDDVQLPFGWEQLCLGLVRRQSSISFNPAEQPETFFELYSVPSHETGRPEIVRGSTIGSNKQYVRAGDVLISKINPRLNRVWVVGSVSDHPKIASTEWIVFSASKHVDSKLLFYILSDSRIRNYLAQNASGVGGSLMRARPALLDSIIVNLPPRREQNRIVAKIEELFSELDKGIEALTTALEQLKAYRQSFLKHAFEGKLTEDWRAHHLDESKAQGDLLSRIRNAREAQYAKGIAEWHKAMAKWRVNGQVGNKPIKPEHLREQPAFNKKELDSLPSLPPSWTWVRLGDLFASSPQNGLYKPASSYGSGVPIIRIDSFYDGAMTPNVQLKRLALLPDEIDKYRVKVGDILINRVNSIEYLGKCALVTKVEESTVFESNIMKFRVLNSEISKRYLVAYLASLGGKNRLCSNAKHAVNQASINQTDVAFTPVPLASTAEQREITSKLEAMLSEAERAEGDIEAQLAKSNALRQSILKQAFSGRLVAQDPKDEPASVLLERIHTERETVPAKKSRNGKNDQRKNRKKNAA